MTKCGSMLVETYTCKQSPHHIVLWKAITSLKVLLQRANIEESGMAHTTPVFAYPLGKSPLGVMDMAGNVWEWQANFINKEFERLAFRGGPWYLNQFVECISGRLFFHISRPIKAWNDYGFRVVALTGTWTDSEAVNFSTLYGVVFLTDWGLYSTKMSYEIAGSFKDGTCGA